MSARTRFLSSLSILFALTACSGLAHAAGAPPTEVGFTLVGVSVLKESGSTHETWLVSAPGGSFLGTLEPGLHATFSLGDRASLEPQLGFTYYRQQGYSTTILNLSMQVNISLQSWTSSTVYLFGRGGVLVTSGGTSATKGVFGGGLGYRAPIRRHAVARWEAYYNRYPASYDSYNPGHTNEFGIRVKLGVLF